MMTPGAARQEGFILVAVLWILAALAAFVTVFAHYVSASTTEAVLRTEGIIASSLTRAAVELAAQRLLAAPKAQRPTHGELSFRMGTTRVVAAFQDEAARIDLNAAPPTLLAGLFRALGASQEAAKRGADRIVGFRSPTLEGGGAEAELYRDAGLDHGPRGAPFAHVEELWRVAGLPAGLVAAALPHLTVYSGRGTVNAGIADSAVRAAVAGGGADGEPEGPVATTGVAGDTARVRVRMAFADGHRRTTEVVILLRETGEDPYQVLDWQDAEISAPEPGATGPEASGGGR